MKSQDLSYNINHHLINISIFDKWSMLQQRQQGVWYIGHRYDNFLQFVMQHTHFYYITSQREKRQVCSHILIIYLLSIAMRTMTVVHQSKKIWTGAFQAYSRQSNCIKSCNELFVPFTKCTFGLSQCCNFKFNETLRNKPISFLPPLSLSKNRYKNFLYLIE